MIRTLMMALCIVFLASAAHADQSRVQKKCNGNCEKDGRVHRHGAPPITNPTKDYVCIFFVQPRQQLVTLRIDFKDGRPSRYYDNKKNLAKPYICPGRQIVRDARFMYICNDEAHADYEERHAELVSQKPTYSKDGTACLFGKDICRSMGYPTRD